MEEMQMVISHPTDTEISKRIEWNKEEVTAFVEEIVRDYKNLVYTDENVVQAKKDRAELNKLKGSLSEKRIAVKKAILAPYDDFENEVKQVVALIDEPINMIDAQIQAYEKHKKEERQKELHEYYHTEFKDLADRIVFNKILNPQWLNASVSFKKAVGQMTDVMSCIKEGVEAIKNTNSEFIAYAIENYYNTLDLAASMNMISKMENIKKEKQEAEKIEREKAEAERKANGTIETGKIEKPQQELQSKPEPQPEAVEKQSESTGQEIAQNVVDPFGVKKIYKTMFMCYGTKEQLLGLKKYMQDNGIRVEKVPAKKEG